jgi:large subunit ribosomal protein L18
MLQKKLAKIKRRIRQKVKGTAEKPRLSIFRSNKHIYAQVIDDTTGKTIASSSTIDKTISSKINSTSTCEASIMVGQYIARKSLEAKVQSVIFDRGGHIYHGRVKALAEAARQEGLKF